MFHPGELFLNYTCISLVAIVNKKTINSMKLYYDIAQVFFGMTNISQVENLVIYNPITFLYY